MGNRNKDSAEGFGIYFLTPVHLSYFTPFHTDAISTIVNDSVTKCKPSAVPTKTNDAEMMIYLIISMIYHCGWTY